MTWIVLSALLAGALAAALQEIRVRARVKAVGELQHERDDLLHEREWLMQQLELERRARDETADRERKLLRDARDRLGRCREAVDALPETDTTRALVLADLNHAFGVLDDSVSEGDTSPGKRRPTVAAPAGTVPR